MPLTPAGQDLAVGSNDQVLETTPDTSGLNRVDGTSRRVEQLKRAPPYCTYGHTALQKAIAGNRCWVAVLEEPRVRLSGSGGSHTGSCSMLLLMVRLDVLVKRGVSGGRRS
jgi:hypothetical protein